MELWCCFNGMVKLTVHTSKHHSHLAASSSSLEDDGDFADTGGSFDTNVDMDIDKAYKSMDGMMHLIILKLCLV